jgi:protein-S-isoprenylcysteine O-methyltransferase Ste14
MAMTTFLLWLLYLGVAFGLRMAIHWKQTGSTGLKVPAASESAWKRLAGVLLVLGAGLGAMAPLLLHIRPSSGVQSWEMDGVKPIGSVLFAIGLVLTFVAQMNMGTSWRIGVDDRERTRLVDGGLFAWVRNPIFSAMLIAFLGLLLLSPSNLGLIAWLISFAAVELQVRKVEEPYLLRIHGQRYRDYTAAVGRFLPFLGRARRVVQRDSRA